MKKIIVPFSQQINENFKLVRELSMKIYITTMDASVVEPFPFSNTPSYSPQLQVPKTPLKIDTPSEKFSLPILARNQTILCYTKSFILVEFLTIMKAFHIQFISIT